MRSQFRQKVSVLLLFICCFAPLAARSQAVTFDSVKIAETLIAANWVQLEGILPVIFTSLETDLKSGGATEKASKIFTDEIRKLMSREGVTRAYSQLIAAKLNADEQRETLTFMNSTAGQKYLALSKQSASEEFLLPMVKQACAGANPQLGFFDRGSLNRMCRGS